MLTLYTQREKTMRNEDIRSIKGIGEKTAALFRKLEITSPEELLRHYPYRYMSFEAPRPLREYLQEAAGEKLVIRAKLIKGFVQRYAGKYKLSSSLAADASGNIEVLWYNSPFLAKSLKLYKEYVFVGRWIQKGGKQILEHPLVYDVQEYTDLIGTLRPVYALTKGLSNALLIRTVQAVLDRKEKRREYLPSAISKAYDLEPEESALQNIHFPESESALQRARRRLVFDEFFPFIYYTRQVKKDSLRLSSAYSLEDIEEAGKALRAVLPYALTKSQEKVIDEILGDMGSGKVMNRLVQGDVGSGKTVISVFAMYACFKNGLQSALMAPTEVLARQHYQNLESLFSPLEDRPRLALLTGSMTKKEHRQVYEELKQGEIDILIGTHALITEELSYHRLALVVTDEQHRFGVRQRQSLSLKGKYPHILVMSATPIPRTLAVILYGDLDISVVDQKPIGRLPIKNAVIGKGEREKAYRHILEEIKKGRQAYVICPMVEESENIEAENVLDYTDKLRTYFPKTCSIAFLHGKMSAVEKEERMLAFARKQIDILVSTTVIEVGIDVKNASVILIEDAQRFGLASLHQLRGRVGRSDVQSYCIFVRTSDKENARKRLEIVGNSNDGFYIANEDLKLRGPGDLFGMAQSGEFRFGLADIYTDADVLREAAEAVDRVLKMALSPEESTNLAERIEEFSAKNYKKLIL